jgi:hypothetical protein
MENLELILIFDTDKGYITREKYFTLNELGLGSFGSVFKKTACLELKILKYFPSECRIFVEIISYKSGNTEFSKHQNRITEDLKKIKKVSFKDVHTEAMLRLMNSKEKSFVYTPNLVKAKINNTESPFFNIPKTPVQNIIPATQKKIFSNVFFLPLEEIKFKDGSVSFSISHIEFDRPLDLSIQNTFIQKEFDSIKEYFGNVLGTKNIEVKVKIEIDNGDYEILSVESKEIKQIDVNLIDSVRFVMLKRLRKKQLNTDIDKNLFTKEEYIETFGENKNVLKSFFKSDQQLFNGILDISETKHYKHLRLLSQKHSHVKLKLRFVHKPFSFVFFVEGGINDFIIWETLDTEEATYIWPVGKDQFADQIIAKIERTISHIKKSGKLDYIKFNQDDLERIYHDYSESIDGFAKWKRELEAIVY